MLNILMMKIDVRQFGLLMLMLVSITKICNAQASKVSFNSAYSMLNSGSKANSVTTTVVSKGSAAASIVGMNFNKKVKVGYAIPIAIFLEYYAVKTRLESDMASDPSTYNSSSGDVQQAFVNLAYGDFVKISEYNKVNVKLIYRFNPAKLVVYGSYDGDFVNNAHSSPWDVSVYRTPNTSVSGTTIMVIKK